MPAKSGKQYKFLQMIAHGNKDSNSKGPSKEVALELIHKTSKSKRKLFSKK